MTRICRHIVSIAGLALCVPAVSAQMKPPPADPRVVTVTEKNVGKTIELHVGDRLVVRLASNPTTGFDWAAKNSNEVALKMPKPPVYESPSTPRIGAGGTKVFSYVASKLGKAELTFMYRRSWEKKAPAKTLRFNFKITARPHAVYPQGPPQQ